jgi:hypothetical protein
VASTCGATDVDLREIHQCDVRKIFPLMIQDAGNVVVGIRSHVEFGR